MKQLIEADVSDVGQQSNPKIAFLNWIVEALVGLPPLRFAVTVFPI